MRRHSSGPSILGITQSVITIGKQIHSFGTVPGEQESASLRQKGLLYQLGVDWGIVSNQDFEFFAEHPSLDPWFLVTIGILFQIV